jgi:hypothetical protein
MKDVKGRRLLRGPRPAWMRGLGMVFYYVLIRPIVAILELFGLWPRLMSRAAAGMTKRMERYEPTDHDVMICSYFKSGTNWTMQMAVQVAYRGKADFEHIHDIVPWLEMPRNNRFSVPLGDGSARLSAPTGLRVIKTHLGMADIVYNSKARYIWVVRDPKDVFVSGYHFLRSVALGPLMPSVEKWLEVYLSKDTYFGSWAEHLQGGWAHRDRENVLFLTYEEMRQDLRAAVERIAEHMKVDLTPEELDAVVRQSSYEHMKSINYKFGTAGLSPPWASPRGAMIRRGQSGGAGELLSNEDQRRIDDYWRAELAGLGSDFPYDEVFVCNTG